jgi:hypothetical protein
MSALRIKDLSVTEELDGKAMKAVRGGYLAYPYFPILKLDFDSSKHADAQQLIQQQMEISNVSGNNIAFATDINTKIEPTMTANNNVTVR